MSQRTFGSAREQRSRGARLWGALLVPFLLLCLILAPAAWAQQTQGTISVTVVDPSGALLPGAQLKLVDLSTNDTRQATTQEAGNYTFVNLNFGQYKLTISKDGFETQSLDVLVQAVRTTDVRATMKVGAAQTVVEVSGAAPLVEATSSAINMTIDMKQIEDLPLGGRNIAQMAQLAAGFNGTWNGLPSAAQGSTVDGVVGNTTRWRYQGVIVGSYTAITPRLENIAEMVVSADQMDMNQGFGSSSFQVTYVTRRGTNSWHGRAYEDFRSSALNAYNWNSPQKAKYHQNEFGVSVGGPILKDKLFVFGSFSALDVPGGSLRTNNYFTDAAKTGVFHYGPGGAYSANLFNVIQAYNTANGTTLPTSVLGVVQQRIAQIDQYRAGQGVAYPTPPSDPNLLTWQWMANMSSRTYYPTFRVDYNFSPNWRLNLAYNQTKARTPNNYPDHWPGDGRGAGYKSNNVSVALGLNTTISPTLINSFKAGWLYTAAWFGTGAPNGYYTNPTIWYGYGGYDDYYELPNSRMQPIFSFNDNVSWSKGAHTFSFGFNATREVNKYWDPPEGYTQDYLWLAEGDPALNALTGTALRSAAGAGAPALTSSELDAAQQLYATLTGRIGEMSGRHPYVPGTGTYATGQTPNAQVVSNTLNELQKTWGLFFQDSYKMKRNLTVNYGLRWDFLSPDKDVTGKYHSMTPQDVFGPTGIWDLFNPGSSSLTGTNDPVFTARQTAYKSWNVTPQPAIGLAWTPRTGGNFIERALGGDKTVVRAGYSIRRFAMPQQFVWDMGSSYGLAFFQNFGACPSTSGDLGTYMPGSIVLGQSGWLPQSCADTPTAPACFTYSPQQYDKIIHQSEATWLGSAVAGIKTNIRQPYTEAWNIGIQRDLGSSRAIEIRYNGNRTIHQWLAEDINEVNIFENGFLDEFEKAQNNLRLFQTANPLCGQSGQPRCSFAYNASIPGSVALPIMTAAGISFTSGSFINNLTNGQAGSFASTLAHNRDYYCRLVGTSFGPCGTSYGAGAGYPINFWMANPFAISSWTNAQYLDDRGFTNYNGLQIEFRQRQWRGMTMTANYTWSKTLGVETVGDWTAGYNQFTIRDLHSAYGPVGTDRNHVIHINATYDLPFGKGKQFLNQGGIVDKVLGGWTLSTIVNFQTGFPFRITGANNTFNNKRDGGIVLNGITAQDITDHMGNYWGTCSGAPCKYYLDPAWVAQIKSDGSITSNNVPGTWGNILYLHGPHQTYADVGISKAAPITERINFKFQMEMLNAFNHPTFGQSTTSLSSSTFGRASIPGNNAMRRIEFRANLEF